MLMKDRKFLLLFLLLSVLLSACSSDDVDDQLTNTVWKCKGYASATDGTLNLIHPDQGSMSPSQYTITFHTDGTVTGFSGANQFSGQYSVIGNRLTINNVQKTLISFIGENIDYDDILFHAIESYTISSNELRLYFDNGQQFLLFSPV